MAALGEIDELVEQLDDVVRNLEPRGAGGRVGIGAGGVRDDGDTNGFCIRFGSLGIATRRLNATLHTAEEVDFIGDVEASINGPILLRRTGRALRDGDAAIGRACAEIALGQAIGPSAGEGGARLLQMGDGDANVGVRLERCLLYTSPSPRDRQKSRMPSSA